ncbi:MAG: UDP-glucose--hexose-1-phosphate uridylyltransferase [Lachnospiraceae bacterium]|nr:UDP-glucose--hexose-1-phosphate uridylyltransferase [Lachnospiraceae bacterium]
MKNEINWLVSYGVKYGLIDEEDRIYTVNRLLDLLLMDSPDTNDEDGFVEKIDENERNKEIENLEVSRENLSLILERFCDYAAEKGLIVENTVTYRDLFDTKVMGILTKRPGEVIKTFNELKKEDTKKATDYFYELAKDTNYIRTDRVAKDKKWKVNSEYGEIDITINLSKPEKDPKAIAAAKLMKQSGYPKCQLCMENEGYAGRTNHPARENLRIIPITLNGEKFGFQYSPYVYYNEHCIVLNSNHTPMKIDRACFTKLLDFVEQFPHYFLGSNADLPIVGGSILTHDHFQGGNYTFAMAKAEIETPLSFKGFEDIKAGIVKWPMSVIRLSSGNKTRIIDLAEKILKKWRNYTDEEAVILANTDGEAHNTITPIARMNNGSFELDLVLRNNLTTPEHPLGLYHPHSELHHIKKENIGLIEVMGLAVLPSRLKNELEEIKNCLIAGMPVCDTEGIAAHGDWADQLVEKYKTFTKDNVDKIIDEEVGKVFVQVLEQAGVYKRTSSGKAAFLRFTDSVNMD